MNNNIDVSKIQLNNKLNNIEFLIKPTVFKNLMKLTNCCTDTSIAYIPCVDYITSFNLSDTECKNFHFYAPCRENNYADLSFINSENKYFNIKACRVKSLNCINLDGNLLTYADDTINDNNFFVFYSIHPSELNKIVIMSTKIYDFLTSYNNDEHILYFNYKYINKIKKAFNFSDSEISIIDLSEKINFDNSEEINFKIKQSYCLKTLNGLKKSQCNKNYNVRTHYGYQYTAFNITNGQIRQFRDAIARNNFFKSQNINLNNHNIIRNCKNMDSIVNNDSSSYKINLLNNGWIICNYIPNPLDLLKFIQNLIIKIKINSVRIFNKIKKILLKNKTKIVFLINLLKNKIKKSFLKIKNNICYFRPLSLLNYVISTNEINAEIYFKLNPMIKKYFKIN